MFDISLAELGVAGIVAVVVFGPQECLKALKYTRYIVIKCKKIISSCMYPIQKELRHVEDHLIDLEGEIQLTYDLEEIEKELNNLKKDGKRKTRKKNI
ncbi:MAG: hypothetical protein IRD7MM_05260 [Candidatus Midichloria mitochondrii]|uniref:hypothetical protein n=1 Tax=Candidatus Midichloria mitochondrii TaxID=234827 RepID=UPI000309AB98|nr:hypothetical protein [Candidatus Midichloria mitochondrii]MDJ1256676.1 hypothetical protein [Candidatus Midichloria mitochondrii]MDJ1288398.1 hypothetical protein [Candidatus Midichloria mitochondrii]MDJ1299238.1 hypothetical protein [Candidatus Midichloria mitochondrii]MDJ1313364.1 hypothetical protein [Candidatus Midichloria mitochondrii]MDJ1583946.1 hypothetical protein [Candidatus Midichloria mitochondrii]